MQILTTITRHPHQPQTGYTQAICAVKDGVSVANLARNWNETAQALDSSLPCYLGESAEAEIERRDR